MKKLIKRIVNVVEKKRWKKEKAAEPEIEIGKSYHVKHTIRKDFYMIVISVNKVWVEGLALDAESREPGLETIAMRQLCIFRELKDKGKMI
jgi:hypothetical protein